MKRNLSLITLLLCALTFSFAQEHDRGHRKMMKKGKMERMKYHKKMKKNAFAHLPDVTEEQKKQFKEIKTDYMKKALSLRNELKEKKAHLESLATKDKPSQSKLNTTIEEIGELKTALMKLGMDKRQKIRGILTEEQRIVFDTKASKMKRKMRKHRM